MFLQALEVFCLNAHVWPASGSTSVAGLPACDSLLVGTVMSGTRQQRQVLEMLGAASSTSGEGTECWVLP